MGDGGGTMMVVGILSTWRCLAPALRRQALLSCLALCLGCAIGGFQPLLAWQVTTLASALCGYALAGQLGSSGYRSLPMAAISGLMACLAAYAYLAACWAAPIAVAAVAWGMEAWRLIAAFGISLASFVFCVGVGLSINPLRTKDSSIVGLGFAALWILPSFLVKPLAFLNPFAQTALLCSLAQPDKVIPPCLAFIGALGGLGLALCFLGTGLSGRERGPGSVDEGGKQNG